jgi:hypothetical protein
MAWKTWWGVSVTFSETAAETTLVRHRSGNLLSSGAGLS